MYRGDMISDQYTGRSVTRSRLGRSRCWRGNRIGDQTEWWQLNSSISCGWSCRYCAWTRWSSRRRRRWWSAGRGRCWRRRDKSCTRRQPRRGGRSGCASSAGSGRLGWSRGLRFLLLLGSRGSRNRLLRKDQHGAGRIVLGLVLLLEDTATCVAEPVVDLNQGQARLSDERGLFILARIGLSGVVPQPLGQRSCGPVWKLSAMSFSGA